jgi:alkyldihydroxyacetonephosphate synthase
MRYYALWGEEGKRYETNQLLYDYIYRELGAPEKEIWDGYYLFDEPGKSDELYSILKKCLPEERISLDPMERISHSIGRGSVEYISLLEGKNLKIVDAVIYPREEEIECIFKELKNIAEIITFGGGTSVTGGVLPSGKRKYSVSLDTRNMNRFELDERSMILFAGAGLKGPDIENNLNQRRLTLGNFPESFLYSTLGGWIATNAAGQESNRYGKIKDMLLGLKMVSPSGKYSDHPVPAESAFYRIADIATGSEGVFGIITGAWLKVRRIPERLYYKAYMFRSFSEGIEALRQKFVYSNFPIVSRLSDEKETYLSLLTIKEGFLTNLFKRYLKLRNVLEKGSLLIIVDDKKISLEGGVNLGSMPAKLWKRTRYDRPYMYNELLRHGIVAETIETSVPWNSVIDLYKNVNGSFRDALRDNGIKGMIMCHASHEYITGTALYFTFLFYSEERREEYLKILRDSIIKSMIYSGGSISHHHGIGKYLRNELKEYKGSFYESIKMMKNYFDPDNILNPGVLE